MGMTANVLPDWLVALQTPLPGETQGQHIARCVQAFNGVSLSQNVAQLDALFLVNETPARAPQVATLQTNCATFARCIFALAGCTSNYVLEPYPIGAGISLVLEAAQQLGCLITAATTPNYLSMLGPGCLIHYAVPNTNDDHVEFCLSVPDPTTGVALHGGGGRPNNAITVGTGDIRMSLGRPIQHIILPTNMAVAGPSVVITPPVDPTPPPAPSQVPANPAPVPITPGPIPATIVAQPSLVDQIMQIVMKVLKFMFTVR
jgi:hypothetical protein